MNGDWFDLGPAEALPPLSARTVTVAGGEDIGVFRTADGGVHALVNKCPHKHGPLSQGIIHDASVSCPLHNWRISLVTGQALGDDKGCTPVIPAKIEDGRIYIERAAALAGLGAIAG
ncbi:MAG: nitrite reductase small subunit NirD [Sphingomonadales bacterium]|nr:nitrite reductase small subunit NirD [Sphingomonadales bacterium]